MHFPWSWGVPLNFEIASDSVHQRKVYTWKRAEHSKSRKTRSVPKGVLDLLTPCMFWVLWSGVPMGWFPYPVMGPAQPRFWVCTNHITNWILSFWIVCTWKIEGIPRHFFFYNILLFCMPKFQHEGKKIGCISSCRKRQRSLDNDFRFLKCQSRTSFWLDTSEEKN